MATIKINREELESTKILDTVSLAQEETIFSPFHK